MPSLCVKLIFKRRNKAFRVWIVFGDDHEHADPPHLRRLLRVRDERPCCRSAAEKRDEIPPPHEAFPSRRTTPYHIEWGLFAPQQTGSSNVRFTPESRHREILLGCPLCARSASRQLKGSHGGGGHGGGQLLAGTMKLPRRVFSLGCGTNFSRRKILVPFMSITELAYAPMH
jgi:hypothetical protein